MAISYKPGLRFEHGNNRVPNTAKPFKAFKCALLHLYLYHHLSFALPLPLFLAEPHDGDDDHDDHDDGDDDDGVKDDNKHDVSYSGF